MQPLVDHTLVHILKRFPESRQALQSCGDDPAGLALRLRKFLVESGRPSLCASLSAALRVPLSVGLRRVPELRAVALAGFPCGTARPPSARRSA